MFPPCLDRLTIQPGPFSPESRFQTPILEDPSGDGDGGVVQSGGSGVHHKRPGFESFALRFINLLSICLSACSPPMGGGC